MRRYSVAVLCRAAVARDFLLDIFCGSINYILVYLQRNAAGERASIMTDTRSKRVSNATETLFL